MTSSGKKLVIIHTNDIHGHFENMPHVAGTIASLRRKYADDHVLIMDLGDHVDRMALETDSSDGLANVEVMNAAGYDLATLGNRELLTISCGRLGELADEYANFSIVLSNLKQADTGTVPGWMKPYLVVNRNIGAADCRIALIGLTHYLPDFYKPLGWEIEEPLECARRWVERLRPEVDVLIVMSHLGLSVDKRLAEQVAGIDVIIGAHSHHVLSSPQNIQGTTILQAGCYGQLVGVAEIDYDPMHRTVSDLHGYCVSTQQYPADESTVQRVSKYRDAGHKKLGEQLTYLQEPLPMVWNSETALGNMLAAGVRQCTDADIGLINAGQFVDGLPAGAISREHLLQACPSPARPCRVVLKGNWIKQALEDALNPEIVDRRIGGFGFSGEYVGTLCLDGVKVDYDPGKPVNERIIAVRIQGSPIEEERDYIVGTVDAFACGKGYTALGQSEHITYPYPGFMREVLAMALADAEIVHESGESRWRNIPLSR